MAEIHEEYIWVDPANHFHTRKNVGEEQGNSIHGVAPDLEGLTPLGKRQAYVKAHRLAVAAVGVGRALGIRPVIEIIPAPKERCVNSQQELERWIGMLTLEGGRFQDLRVISHSPNLLLRGIDPGHLNGLDDKAIAERYPAYSREYQAWKEQRRLRPPKPPGSTEDYSDVELRASQALNNIATTCEAGSIVSTIVSRTMHTALLNVLNAKNESDVAPDGRLLEHRHHPITRGGLSFYPLAKIRLPELDGGDLFTAHA